ASLRSAPTSKPRNCEGVWIFSGKASGAGLASAERPRSAHTKTVWRVRMKDFIGTRFVESDMEPWLELLGADYNLSFWSKDAPSTTSAGSHRCPCLPPPARHA